jgi:chromosome segregation ATPase
MPDANSEMQELIEDLKRQRDEIRVRLHLAKADLKDEWERLEQKWSHFERKAKEVGHEAQVTARDVAAVLRLAAEELRKGYARMRHVL